MLCKVVHLIFLITSVKKENRAMGFEIMRKDGLVLKWKVCVLRDNFEDFEM